MPTVSVLMSVFNGEAYIAAAIRSVLEQTFVDFELLIVDDGSTDFSPDILREFAALDERVRVLRNHRNMGLSESLNRGLAEARSPLIARMDADDLCAPMRLERQVAFLAERPEVDVLGSWLQVFGRQTVWERPLEHDDLQALLCFETCFWHPTVMFRREGKDRSGLRDAIAYDPAQTYAEDYGLWVRLALDHGARFANVGDPLVHYRLHPASVSRTHRSTQVDISQAIRRSQLERLGLPATDATAEIHYLLSTQRLGAERDFLRQANDWMARLKDANDRSRIYPREAFARRLEILSGAVAEKYAARWAPPPAQAAE
jgi:glycosyltransferase involved in cell wall biosynthesis